MVDHISYIWYSDSYFWVIHGDKLRFWETCLLKGQKLLPNCSMDRHRMRVICETINAGMQPLQNLSTWFIHVVILKLLIWSWSTSDEIDPLPFTPNWFHILVLEAFHWKVLNADNVGNKPDGSKWISFIWSGTDHVDQYWNSMMDSVWWVLYRRYAVPFSTKFSWNFLFANFFCFLMTKD